MTELEQRLASALEALGKQYAADVNALSQQVQTLSLRLDEQSSASAKRIEALSKRLDDQTSSNEKLAKALLALNSKLNELAEG